MAEEEMHSSAYESAVAVGVGGGGVSCCCNSSGSSNSSTISTSSVNSGSNVDDRGGAVKIGETSSLNSAEILVAITTLVTEGRIPDKVNTNFRGYSEGPHCYKSKSSVNHTCNAETFLCSRYEKIHSHVVSLWQKSIPVCIEVLLTADCECGKLLANHLDISSSSSASNNNNNNNNSNNNYNNNNNNNNGSTNNQLQSTIAQSNLTSSCSTSSTASSSSSSAATSISSSSPTTTTATTNHTEQLLLEQWFLTVDQRRSKDSILSITTQQLLNAVRSQLHFSQLAAWLSIIPDNNTNNASMVKQNNKNIIYRLTIPGETYDKQHQSTFTPDATEHNFPLTEIGNNHYLKVSMRTLPRLDQVPKLTCTNCDALSAEPQPSTSYPCCVSEQPALLDDRMHFSCTKHGKHKCTYDEDDIDLDLDSRLKETDLKHKSKVRCLHSSNDAAAADKTTDLLCRRDYESFVQNQPSRISTINYFTVPSTSKCVLNKNSNNYDQISDSGAKTTVFKSSSACSSAGKSKLLYNLLTGEAEDRSSQNDLNQSQQQYHYRPDDQQSKGDILLNAIMRSSHKPTDATDNDDSGDDVIVVGNETGSNKCDEVVDSGVACDKCDKKHDILSDNNNLNNNKIYSYTNNSKASKYNNYCDSILFSGDDSNNKTKKAGATLVERRCSPIKKRLEIDCCQKPPNNDSSTALKQLRDRTISIARIILQNNRKDLIKNPSALETKRKIDFTESESSAHTEDGLRKRTLLNANCSTSYVDDEVSLLDKECENYTQNIQEIPSALDQKKFRKSLDNAASMVFHSRTGLPLTSSPAPIRKGAKCFDFDSKLNSVSAIRSVLFELANLGSNVDEDSESDSSAVSPCSPDTNLNYPKHTRQQSKCIYAPSRSGLLGTFEESVLHGRLEPVSTVQGFTAELGASGLFCPNHKTFPVTVFFYSLGDMDRMSVPYLGHINLGKKGYNVPKSGLVQITLFNPMGTVVKMFVISYDLSDMPTNSQTFIRQRTLYLPQNCPELQRPDLEYSDKWGQKYLRFLIHLRFMSSKSGRIYLHTDIRMIIFNKSDMDTATGLTEPGHEMRSFIYCPTNPKYSPRK